MKGWTPALAGVLVAASLVACTGEDGGAAVGPTAAAGGGAAPVTAPAAPTPAATMPPAADPDQLAFTVAADGPTGALVGVEHADTVVEYPLAADRTGWLVLTGTPAAVGPLRAATPSDATLAQVAGSHLVTARTTTAVVDDLADAGLAVVEEHTVAGGLVRDPARRAPFNLYARPAPVRAGLAAPPATAVWHPGAAPPGQGRDRDEVVVEAADGVTVTWTWEPSDGRWLRTAGGRLERTATGLRVAVDTVIVLEVAADGRPPVVADLIGSGPATVLRDGRAHDGRWERGGDDAVPVIHATGGVPAAGTQWLHLCAAPCPALRDPDAAP